MTKEEIMALPAIQGYPAIPEMIKQRRWFFVIRSKIGKLTTQCLEEMRLEQESNGNLNEWHSKFGGQDIVAINLTDEEFQTKWKPIIDSQPV